MECRNVGSRIELERSEVRSRNMKLFGWELIRCGRGQIGTERKKQGIDRCKVQDYEKWWYERTIFTIVVCHQPFVIAVRRLTSDCLSSDFCLLLPFFRQPAICRFSHTAIVVGGDAAKAVFEISRRIVDHIAVGGPLE